MKNRKYFLGVDGGGSKTTAVVFSNDGEFIGRAVGESINYYSVGFENARRAMKEIMEKLPQKSFDCAVIGMSALNDRASPEETERFCSGIIDSKKTIMDSDLYVALEAVGEKGECAVIISGTGSVAALRKNNGKIKHAGGWGYILGDEGSGYSIGLRGIKNAIRAYEEIADETTLIRECKEHFKTDNLYDLIDLYYTQKVTRKKTAAFAARVCECAENGDKAALKIIETEADLLCETAVSLLKSAKKEIPIGLWGGVFQHSAVFRDYFIRLLNNQGFENVKLLNFTPEVGAIIACCAEESPETLDIIKECAEEAYLNYNK
ncbi:MAG: N-acetylglucosamine kinase [Acutalibacteraceae bacterium]